MRHEKRNRADATFLSPLLPEGVRDARGPLVNRIEEIRPTHIYASPFLRVLQTVQPYVSKVGRCQRTTIAWKGAVPRVRKSKVGRIRNRFLAAIRKLPLMIILKPFCISVRTRSSRLYRVIGCG